LEWRSYENGEKELAMLSKKGSLAVPLGLLCVIISVTIGRFGSDALPLAAFLEGLFLGMSLVFAVFGLVTRMLARRYE
jgi:hypothetical protein